MVEWHAGTLDRSSASLASFPRIAGSQHFEHPGSQTVWGGSLEGSDRRMKAKLSEHLVEKLLVGTVFEVVVTCCNKICGPALDNHGRMEGAFAHDDTKALHCSSCGCYEHSI